MLTKDVNNVRSPSRFRVSTILMITVFITLLFYGIIQYRDVYNRRVEMGSRCLSELTNLKYQLDTQSETRKGVKFNLQDLITNIRTAVLEYKKMMDAVIADVQQECYTYKQALKKLADSYTLVRSHLDICEMQNGEFELETKELKDELKKTNTELTTCKKAPG